MEFQNFNSLAKTKSKNFYEFRGKRRSLKCLAAEFNINYRTLDSRIKKGWSIEKAIEIPSKKAKQYVYKGKLCTIAEISAMTKMNKGIIRSRLNRGWSVEKTVETQNLKYKGCNSAGSVNRKPYIPELITFATCAGRCNAK